MISPHLNTMQIKLYSANTIVMLFAVILVRDVGAQTYVERVGLATAHYYGSSFMISMIADAGCRSHFHLRPDAYNSAITKKQILVKLKSRIPTQDFAQLPGLLSKAEAEIKRDFGSVFKNLNESQCLKVVPEFEKMFQNNKRVWDALLN